PKIEFVEDLAPKELTMELDQLGGLAPKLSTHLVEEALGESMLLEEGATTMLLHDVGLAPRHVDEPVRGIAVEVERPHRPRLRLVGAAQEAVEPGGGDDHIVVHEADVLRVGVGEGEATGLHGREVVLGADEGEAALLGAAFQVSPDGSGRAAV